MLETQKMWIASKVKSEQDKSKKASTEGKKLK